MSVDRRLVVATRSSYCSCPCAVAHSGPFAPRVTCKVNMPAGSTVGVTLLDGKWIATRCLPCAMASGWPAEMHGLQLRAVDARAPPQGGVRIAHSAALP